MTTRVLSLRLPPSVDRALRASAANANISVSEALEWLLRNSTNNLQPLDGLEDCSERLTLKLDSRISTQTFEQLRAASRAAGVSVSVFTRIFLYHFYVSKRLCYVKSGDRYTLAARHD